jgi:hypothetical protein
MWKCRKSNHCHVQVQGAGQHNSPAMLKSTGQANLISNTGSTAKCHVARTYRDVFYLPPRADVLRRCQSCVRGSAVRLLFVYHSQKWFWLWRPLKTKQTRTCVLFDQANKVGGALLARITTHPPIEHPTRPIRYLTEQINDHLSRPAPQTSVGNVPDIRRDGLRRALPCDPFEPCGFDLLVVLLSVKVM